jgi:hypothetical protein
VFLGKYLVKLKSNVDVQIVVLWVVTRCNLVGGYRPFGGTLAIFQVKMDAASFPESAYDTSQCHIPEDHTRNNEHRGNLKHSTSMY